MDYFAGSTNIELAGGNHVRSDPVQGAVQLVLFVLGLLAHWRLWLRTDTTAGPLCMCGCCPGAAADEEAARNQVLDEKKDAALQATMSAKRRSLRASQSAIPTRREML